MKRIYEMNELVLFVSLFIGYVGICLITLSNIL